MTTHDKFIELEFRIYQLEQQVLTLQSALCSLQSTSEQQLEAMKYQVIISTQQALTQETTL
ncbi:hypothetical protein [Oceanimonas smirnovii]|uniref:hypothetical protein n=1 Tax=Oceanimonas smirnovii TaxID=264574 RepID=UPI003FD36DAC